MPCCSAGAGWVDLPTPERVAKVELKGEAAVRARWGHRPPRQSRSSDLRLAEAQGGVG